MGRMVSIERRIEGMILIFVGLGWLFRSRWIPQLTISLRRVNSNVLWKRLWTLTRFEIFLFWYIL